MKDEFEPKISCSGAFGNFAAYGVLYQERGTDQIAERVWHLTLVEAATPQHPDIEYNYWIRGTEFRNVVQTRLLEGGTPASTIFLAANIADPPQPQKQAALEAIHAWEQRLQTAMTVS
jgi:hypothetical protein